MKNILLIILVLFFAYSCNMSDSSEDLGGGYTFVHEGKEYNTIGGGKHQILPNVIEYVFNNDYILVCQKPNKILYKSLLGSYLWSDYYLFNSYMKDSLTEKFFKSRNEILADSTIFKIFKNRKVTFENSIEDIKKSEKIVDSILKSNPIHKKIFSLERVYWIIKIKGDILFGPLTRQEYLSKRKSIGIDEDLKLIN